MMNGGLLRSLFHFCLAQRQDLLFTKGQFLNSVSCDGKGILNSYSSGLRDDELGFQREDHSLGENVA